MLAGLGLLASTGARAQDGDAVADAGDAYPCDGSLAATAYAPAADTFGMLLFEDQWPRRGDEDTNDLVLAHNFVYRLDAQGRVVSMRVNFDALALGAQLDNGLGLHIAVPRNVVSRIFRQVGAGAAQDLVPEADGELTVRVSSDLRELFGGRSGQINTLTTQARVASTPLVVEIVFSTPTSSAPHDVFLFRKADFGHQIHRPEFAGTMAMDTALFGSAHDGSGPNCKFVDTRGVPFVFVMPLSSLYPDLLTFAALGGTQAQNFYVATSWGWPAYADAAGQPQLVATTPTAEPAPDTACLPTCLPACLPTGRASTAPSSPTAAAGAPAARCTGTSSTASSAGTGRTTRRGGSCPAPSRAPSSCAASRTAPTAPRTARCRGRCSGAAPTASSSTSPSTAT